MLDRPERVVDGPVGRWGPFVSVVAAATRTVEDVVACSEGEIATGMGVLDEAQAMVQRSLVLVAVEAHRRGLHVCSGLSMHDWVAARCRWLPRPVVADVVLLVREWDRTGHGPVREAVADGRLSVPRAARLLRALLRVRPVSDVTTYGGSTSRSCCRRR